MGIRRIKNPTMRVPAGGETTELSSSNGWAADAAAVLDLVDTTKSDPGVLVCTVSDSTVTARSTIVYFNTFGAIKTGLPGQEYVPAVSKAASSAQNSIHQPLGVVEDIVTGSFPASSGSLIYVRRFGIHSSSHSVVGTIGDPVYVDSSGHFNGVAGADGTYIRRIGTLLSQNRVFFDDAPPPGTIQLIASGSTPVSFLVAGSNVTITSSSNGQIVIASSGGSSPNTGSLIANTYTLEQFGGSLSGSASTNFTAMSGAINAIRLAGSGSLIFGAGSYNMQGVFNLPANCSVVGQGPDVSKLIYGTNGVLFTQNGDNVFLCGFSVTGNGGGSQQLLQTFSGSNGFSNTRVENVVARSFGSYAFWAALQGTSLNGARFLRTEAYNCATGFRAQTEYTTFTDCIAKDNTEGYQIVAGNLTWTGGEITGNSTGVHIVNSGGNDAHGTIIGTKINHNNAVGNVVADATANGYVFVGCHLYEGNLVMTSAHTIRFTACHVSPTHYYFDGSWTVFDGCTFPGLYGDTVHNNYNGNTSFTRWIDPVNLNGAIPAFIMQGQDGNNWQNLVNGSQVVSGSSIVSGSIVISGSSKLYAGDISSPRVVLNDSTFGHCIFGGNATGTGWGVHAGPYPGFETSHAAIWGLASGTVRSGANLAMSMNSTDTAFAGPANLYFGVGGANYMTMNSTAFQFGTSYSTYQYKFDFDAAAIIHFGVNATTSALIRFDPKVSDVSTKVLTIQGQDAYSGASVANANGGNIVVAPGIGAVTGSTGQLIVSASLMQITGAVNFHNGLSGSHTKLENGTSFLVAGSNVTITTSSAGQVTIASTATGGGGSSNGWIDGAGKMKTTGSISIDASSNYADAIGTDVFFYVSGSRNVLAGANRHVAVVGGDLVLSGSVLVPPTTQLIISQ